jgi:hypothetical protein
MSRLPRLITAVAVTFLLAACGQGSDNPVGPSGPSMDGGILIGGGNRTQPDSTVTSGQSAQGGVLIGGGN